MLPFRVVQKHTSRRHPTTIFLTVHRGASTFVASHLAPAIARVLPGMRHVEVGSEILDGTPVERIALPPTGVVASRVYPFLYDSIVEDPAPPAGRFSDKKLVMIRRDPRDVAVSLYYAIRDSHTERTRFPERFRARRKALRELGVVDGVARHTAATAIDQFRATFDFLARHSGTCLTTYEMLVADFGTWFERVRIFMEWTPRQAARVAAGLQKEVQPPSEVDAGRHKRRVTAGNWREVFDDALRQRFENEIGAELAEAGYAW